MFDILKVLAAVSLAALLAPIGAGCSDAGPSSADVADTLGDDGDDTLAPTGPFGVAIEASALSGNAPLTIDFSVRLTPPEGAPDDWTSNLRYRWFVDDIAAGTEATFQYAFFRAGTIAVAVEVSWPEADLSVREVVAVRMRGCADLRFEDFALAEPLAIAPGGLVTIGRGRLVNAGDTVEGPFDIAIGLGTSEFWDQTTGQLSEVLTIEGIGAGASVDLAGRTFRIADGVAPGTYAAFLVADPSGVVNECQEANNALAGIGALDVDPNAALRPDLVLDSIDIPESLVIKQGDDLNFGFRIRNVGDADSRNFRYGFWLSRDPIVSPETDIVVADPADQGSRVQNLPSGAALGFLRTWRVPESLEDGQWWLVGRVDATNAVFEHDETANDAASAWPLTMRYEAPTCADLDVAHATAVTLNTTASYWGGSVRATVEVRNPGTVATPDGWTLRAYLSQQPSLNPTNARIAATVTGGVIEAGSLERFEIIIPITNDLPVFPHYIGVRADPLGLVEECDEGNNSRMHPTPVTIEAVARVDLVASDFVYHPTTVAAGTGFRAEWRVANRGTSAATAFRAVIALSAVNTFSPEAFADGRAVVLDRLTVPSLGAGEETTFLRQVPVPRSLDHAVAGWHVAAIADPDRLITADVNSNNNLVRGATLLTVTGAEGGCFEDALEPNDTLMQASVVEADAMLAVGVCGNADFLAIPVERDASLVADIVCRPIISTPPVSAEVDIELRDPAGALVAVNGVGTQHRLTAFLAAESGIYTLSLRGRTAQARAACDVVLSTRTPSDAAELALGQPALDPAVAFPGGRLAVRVTEANLGRAVAAPHALQVALVRDPANPDSERLDLGPTAVAALDPLSQRETTIIHDLPLGLGGGAWHVVVTADPEGVVAGDTAADNQVSAGPLMVDVARSCASDRFEPNDAPAFATVASATIAAQRFDNAIVCPGQEDWYALDLSENRSLRAEIQQDYDPARGRVELSIINPDGLTVHAQTLVSASGSVELPHNFAPGRWYVRIRHGDAGFGLPIVHDVTVSTTSSPAAARCTADTHEPDSSLSLATPMGCARRTATLCRTDVDHHRLRATVGVPLGVTLTHPDGHLKMTLLAADGVTALTNRLGNGLMTWNPTVNGDVTVRVESRVGSNTLSRYDYTLDVTGVQAADLAVSGLATETDRIEPGEELGVAFDVVNACGVAAPGFATGVYLSADTRPGPGDIELAQVLAPAGLAGGAAQVFDEKLRVPASTAPGDWFVLVWADIGEGVEEPDRANNVAVMPLRVRAPCSADRFESNDSGDTATAIAAGAWENLAICAGDFDWFALDVPARTRVTVTALFAHADGDLDMRVFDAAQGLTVPVAVANSRDDDESLSIDVMAPTRLLVRVHGYLGAVAPYTLQVATSPF
jgi:hypothetical protein